MRLMRIGEVCSTTGLQERHLYRLISAGRFPRQVKLSERSSAWRSEEVEGWIKARRSPATSAAAASA